MLDTVFNRCFETQGHGAIVNIVCDMFRGFPMMSHTGAARAAVENLTRYTINELLQTTCSR